MFLAAVFGDVTTIDGVVQVVLTLEYRGASHLYEAGEISGIETAETLADTALRRSGGIAQLRAQSLIKRERWFEDQAV